MIPKVFEPLKFYYIGTDRSNQTVQIQIRLILNVVSLDLTPFMALPFHLYLCVHQCIADPNYTSFRTITVASLGVPFLEFSLLDLVLLLFFFFHFRPHSSLGPSAG